MVVLDVVVVVLLVVDVLVVDELVLDVVLVLVAEVVVDVVSGDVVSGVVVSGVVVSGVVVVEGGFDVASSLDTTEAQLLTTMATATASAVIAGRVGPSTRGRVSRCRVASRS